MKDGTGLAQRKTCEFLLIDFEPQSVTGVREEKLLNR